MDHNPHIAYHRPFPVSKTKAIVGRNLIFDHGLQDRTAPVNENFYSTESDGCCSGDCSSSQPRTERRTADQSIVRADLVRPASLSCFTSESDTFEACQSSRHRLLGTRDPDEMSPPPDGGNHGHNPTTFWQPFYLRKTTSLLFVAVFVLMIAALESLFVISIRQSGLPGGLPFMRYLWSYGTTGILTVTAAFWHLLDYETKVSVPWFKAIPVTTSKKALVVDYMDTWLLLVPFKALRNRDWDVACNSTISLLLQVVIVLSTSFFALIPTRIVNDAESILFTSRFVDDPARLKNSKSLLPYYIAMGSEPPSGLTTDISTLRNPNLTYPEGCTNQFAYQTFDTVSPNLIEVKATVDRLSLGLACETASVAKRVTMPQFQYTSDGYLTLKGEGPYLEVAYDDCQVPISWDIFTFNSQDYTWVQNNETFHVSGMVLRGIPGIARNQCNSTEKDAHRLVFLSIEVEWYSTNQSVIAAGEEITAVNINATVSQAVALACTPSLEQTLLGISRNSEGVQSVSPLGGSPADSLKATHPWDFIDFFFDRDIILSSTNGVIVGNMTVWADMWSEVVLAFCGQSCKQTSGLLNGTFLQEILASFFSGYAAATAHVLLRERVNIPSTGSSLSDMARLRVQPVVCQTMVALLAVIIFIILGTQFKHKKMLLCRIDAGSIAATAILAGRVASSGFPKGLGPANTEELHKWLDIFVHKHYTPYSFDDLTRKKESSQLSNLGKTQNFECPTSSYNTIIQNPVPLRPPSRIALLLATAGCGITLIILLRKSAYEQGLGDTDGSKYLSYLWTTVPATILTALSWWLSSIDTQIRLLAPYNYLKRGRCDSSILQMDLMRGLIPTILYQELKSSNFVAVVTTFAALLGATLTTASAAMFHVITYSVSSPIELIPKTVFITPTPKPNTYVNDSHGFGVIGPSYVKTTRPSSLILETNMSYSQEVFQNLMFPTFFATTSEVENASHTTNVSSFTIQATTPALRPRLSCRAYSQADIEAVYMRDQSLLWSRDPLNGVFINITLENSCWNFLFNNYTAFFETGNLSEFLFAAATPNQAGTVLIRGCSNFLYIWGSHDSSPGRVNNISAMGCNTSAELVDVTVSLLEADLRLDPSVAPQAIESTVRDIVGYGALESFNSLLYSGLAPLATTADTIFDTFFKGLVTSRYAIPVSAIGDPTQNGVVMDAIRLQHGVIQAQFLSANYRIDIGSPNATANATNVLIPTLFDGSTTKNSTTYPATVIYPFGRQRVVQDPTASAVLGALLLSILILSALGWWFGPQEAALQRSPTSVASVLALLAGGNLLEHIYDEGPEPRSWEDVESRLGKDSRFYLGWGPLSDDGDSTARRFGIWMTN